MTLRTRRTVLTRSRRATWRTGAAFACLTIFTLRYWPCFAGVSATCTAPPPISAQPAAQADSFARAIRTDIGVLSCCFPDAKLSDPPEADRPFASATKNAESA
jgi:hypothetical protein